MYRQHRYQRTKGSEVQKMLQASFLVCLVIWLLYETKHSFDGKKESTETDYSTLSNAEKMIFGRKVNPGSQSGVSTTEATTKSGGNQSDASDWRNEEKAEEPVKEENEESQEDLIDSTEDEEKQVNAVDSAESHGTKDSRSEGDGTGGGLGEAATSDDVTASSVVNSSKSGQTGGEHNDSAVSEAALNSLRLAHSGKTGDVKNDGASAEDRSESKEPESNERSVETANNTIMPAKEAEVSNTDKHAVERGEVADVSEVNKAVHIELLTDSMDTKQGGGLEITGSDTSGVESLTEGELDDLSQENKQIKSEMQAKETEEEAESHEDDATNAESAAMNVNRDTTRLESDAADLTISDSSNVEEESADTEQKETTGSLSSSVEENADVKKSVEL